MNTIKKGLAGLLGFLLIICGFAASIAIAAENIAQNVQPQKNTQLQQQEQAGQKSRANLNTIPSSDCCMN